ncbi:MAG: 4Fe-4S binding protein [Thermodesulfobacteriota bacterium]
MQTTHTDHRSQIVSGLCTVYRAPGFHCRRCADSCPVEAIEIGRQGPRISAKCIGCGICFASCPNGAFCLNGSDEEVSRLKAAAQASVKKEAPLRISCRRGDAAADVIVPCLARLTEASLLAPFKEGAAAIELLQPSCASCKWHRAAPLIGETLARTQKLLEMIDISVDNIRVRDTRFKAAEAEPDRSMSRRGLLREIGARALQATVEKMPVISDQSGENAADGEFQENLRKREPNEKRIRLLKSIDGFEAVQVVAIPAALAPLAEVYVTEQCMGCKACATLCPTGAIVLEEDHASFCLKFVANLCSNCGLCHELCRHGALHRKEEVVLNKLLKSEESILFESRVKSCRICGFDFVGNGNEVCALCASRIKKQQDLVRNLTVVEI